MLKCLLITLVMWKAFANTNNQYLVCKSVSNIFQEPMTVRTNQTLRGRPGPPGKRGPRGFQVYKLSKIYALVFSFFIGFVTNLSYGHTINSLKKSFKETAFWLHRN